MNVHRISRSAGAACAVALVLAGCGGGGGGTSAPVDLVAGRDGAVGYHASFVGNVKSAPPDAPAVSGLAELVVGKKQTRFSLTASGFDNTAGYAAYVDTDTCAATDPGGAHYKFDPAGQDAPPNVLRLDLTFLEDAHGVKHKGVDADKTFDGVAGPDAKSVVIYLVRAPRFHSDNPNAPKIACADLSPGSG